MAAAAACVRVPLRSGAPWAESLREVQQRLREAAAIGAAQRVVALRAPEPPHARVVRADDAAPGELLEAVLGAVDDDDGGGGGGRGDGGRGDGEGGAPSLSVGVPSAPRRTPTARQLASRRDHDDDPQTPTRDLSGLTHRKPTTAAEE